MKKLSVLAGLALALGIAALPMSAQDETPGQQTQLTVSAPTGGHSCGRSSYPLYCFGVPMNVGGTFWLDVYYKAYGGPTGFILFNGVLDLDMAQVTGFTYTTIPVGQPFAGQLSTVHVEFTGLTNDGDSDTFTGTADLTFSYIASGPCSGRGCSMLPVRLVKSGTLVVTYN